jgi:hypothetical protein
MHLQTEPKSSELDSDKENKTEKIERQSESNSVGTHAKKSRQNPRPIMRLDSTIPTAKMLVTSFGDSLFKPFSADYPQSSRRATPHYLAS